MAANRGRAKRTPEPTSRPIISASTPQSPFYDEAALTRGVGIRFKGHERDDVEEYCVSENWIRAPVGKTRDRKGNLLTIRMTGVVEAYFLRPAEG